MKEYSDVSLKLEIDDEGRPRLVALAHDDKGALVAVLPVALVECEKNDDEEDGAGGPPDA
jgi:hypothetical protein